MKIARHFNAGTPIDNAFSPEGTTENSTPFQLRAVPKPPPKIPPPGAFYDIGGRRLHAIVSGESTAQPPVVLEAGLTAMSSCWHWVQDELSKSTKVLSYDRAGLGWSDSAEEPRHAKNIASDLHRLLDAANFPRPFIFAGHSLGGIFGRAYQSMWPEDIAGLALIDAVHPDQLERSPQIKWAFRRLFWYLRAASQLAPTGAQRVVGDFGISDKASEGLPALHKLATKEFFTSPRHLRASLNEADQWNTSMSQVRDRRLGALPLLVLTAPIHRMQGWLDLQHDLAQLSTRARHVTLENSTHLTILTKKDFAERTAHQIRTPP